MIEAEIEDSLLLIRAKALRKAPVELLAIMSGHADRIDLDPFEVYYILGMHNKCLIGRWGCTIPRAHGCLEANSLYL